MDNQVAAAKKRLSPAGANLLLLVSVAALIALQIFIRAYTDGAMPLWLMGVAEVGLFGVPSLVVLLLARKGMPGKRVCFGRFMLVVGLGLSAVAVIMFVTLPWRLVCGMLQLLVDPHAVLDLNPSIAPIAQYTAQPLWALLLCIAVAPAVGEEILFRGVYMPAFAARPVKAVFLSAFLFALMHMDLYNLFPIFVLGLFMGFVAMRTGNVFLAMVLHFIQNGMSVLLLKYLLPLVEQVNAMDTNMAEPSYEAIMQITGVGMGILLFIVMAIPVFVLCFRGLMRSTRAEFKAWGDVAYAQPAPRMGLSGGVFMTLSILLMAAMMVLNFVPRLSSAVFSFIGLG
ncbi:MAG: CPBP family intramembrane glutamic endopeptidase [Christensenellales bacterium]|jgi:membrane protease YdiL (CAAX protease family)